MPLGTGRDRLPTGAERHILPAQAVTLGERSEQLLPRVLAMRVPCDLPVRQPRTVSTVGHEIGIAVADRQRRSLDAVPCLQDERIIGFVALGVAIVLVGCARPLRRRWPVEFPGVPLLDGWISIACCAFAFSGYFLATGFGFLSPGALAGCN